MLKAAWVIVLFSILLCSSCRPFPRDPNNTLEEVKNKVLRVGLAHSDTSGRASSNPVSYEIKLVEEFARHLNARIEWVNGTQSDIIELLHHYQLHLAIGSYKKASPFKKDVAFSKPYLSEKIKVAAPVNSAVPQSIEGEKVLVSNHLAAYHVKEKGGIPVLVDSLMASTELVAASERDLTKLNVQHSGIVLHKQEFVIAAPKGENAFLIELEKFIDTYGKSK